MLLYTCSESLVHTYIYIYMCLRDKQRGKELRLHKRDLRQAPLHTERHLAERNKEENSLIVRSEATCLPQQETAIISFLSIAKDSVTNALNKQTDAGAFQLDEEAFNIEKL